MNKKYYKNLYASMIDKNYEKLMPYQELDFEILCNIEGLIHENFKCLLFDNYISSIALSNHHLERLLKEALIYNMSLKKGKVVSLDAYKKYQGKSLRQTIDECKKVKIINDKVEKDLKEKIDKQYRNGFSHSEYEKILEGQPYTFKVFKGNFSKPGVTEEEIDRRHFLSVSNLLVYNFAKENAFTYFKYLCDLTMDLDKTLQKI